MINQHVTKEEWQSFFLNRQKGREDVQLTSRVLSHVLGCPDCRAFYDRACDLSRAAGAYAASMNAREESGYAAVASLSAQSRTPDEANAFRVEMDVEDGRAVFLADTAEASGTARQYAVNPEKENTCLREDEQAFTLTLTGTRLTIRVEPDLQGRVQAVLYCYEQDQTIAFNGCDASAELPDNDIYILELIFH